jgi:dihydrofolate reductase
MNSSKSFKAIAAMSENRVIGNQGDIPWNLPEEFGWFKEKTMGGILVMGRKTYESIGKPLPGRETYLLSRKPLEVPGVTCITDLRALEQLQTEKTIWIAGGAEIYRQSFHLCDEIFLTRIHQTVEGDTFFPPFEDDFEIAETVRKTPDFTIHRWVRKTH